MIGGQVLRRMLQIFLSGLALCGLSACAQNPLLGASPYQVFEMRSDFVQPGFPIRDEHIAWIDNERVLFEAWDKVLKDTEPSIRPRTGAWRGLYIWNIRTGQVTRYTSEPLRDFLCFAEGYINYVVSRGGKHVRLEGPFGHETPLDPLPNEAHRLVNRFTCRSYDHSSLPKPIVGGGIEPLRPEHGWLEQTGSATWFRSPEGLLTLLKHEERALGPVRPQKYSMVSGKYVFWRPSDNKTWLITGAGATELQPLPNGPIQRGRLEPAASGALLLRSTQLDVRKTWDPGAAGLYKYQASSVPNRLVTGLVHAMRVHGRGCLIAVIVDPWDRKERKHQLKAVNACLGNDHVGK